MMRAKGLSLHLGGRAILDQVSCTVRPGQVTVVMGQNGAGKSTLLQCLAGSVGADAGAVEVDGQCLAALPPEELAAKRAVLAQSVHLSFPLTVAEVIEMGCYARYQQWTARQRTARIDHYLTLLDLQPFRDRSFPTLSGGEQKRVLLAKCLLQLDADPAAPSGNRYLLLDEPTAALDIGQQFRFIDLATSLARKRGLGVFAVLHDLNLAARFADEIIFLRDGRVLASGPTHAILTRTTIRDTFDVDCLIQEHPHYAGPLITTLPYERPYFAPA
ncbi:heme ABC transporter ATP-binding protein [Neolewinella lacunae]|uniref:Heme ABC transporter ATP-binding protein n=1 Tax=Neolewinella lacunae TaxID=1517758 RepID=A0A923PF90_9BACT|nr:heme ABC transporter ATP-binding protein [Neolewinella lacunae]MBC6992987.1 heme ABC transporter ATP-binding protein [Neolewinella lacunae]MDN3635777.1 heme ABC transporter ATP-binding protein [Neolewinella lacunae]